MCSIFPSVPAVATFLFVLYHLLRSGKPKRHKSSSELNDVHKILWPRPSSLASMLERRAVANIRLVHAFGFYTSTFTNPSVEVNKSFRKNVAGRMKTINSPDDWKDLGDRVLTICRTFLSRQSSYNYDEFVEVVVFTTVLSIFFQIPETLPDFSELAEATKSINKLWIDSKSPTFHRTVNLDLPAVNRRLQTWLTPDPDNPFYHNPLEIIIPAYETMWRLVAHTYVYVENSKDCKSIFLAFADNPTISQFRTSENSASPSAENIIHETLRLHSPTKRIKRAAPLSWSQRQFASLGLKCFSERETIAADIQGLHTSSVWAPLTHEFDALRHINLTEEQKRSFMPFGYGPLKCIATEFAPRFAAIIIGSLLKVEDAILTRGDAHGEREGWQGWKYGILFSSE